MCKDRCLNCMGMAKSDGGLPGAGLCRTVQECRRSSQGEKSEWLLPKVTTTTTTTTTRDSATPMNADRGHPDRRRILDARGTMLLLYHARRGTYDSHGSETVLCTAHPGACRAAFHPHRAPGLLRRIDEHCTVAVRSRSKQAIRRPAGATGVSPALQGQRRMDVVLCMLCKCAGPHAWYVTRLLLPIPNELPLPYTERGNVWTVGACS